jgi:hypothetical protein
MTSLGPATSPAEPVGVELFVVEVGVAEGAGVVESPPSHSAELVTVATASVLPEMIEGTGSAPVAVASLQDDSRGKKRRELDSSGRNFR